MLYSIHFWLINFAFSVILSGMAKCVDPDQTAPEGAV